MKSERVQIIESITNFRGWEKVDAFSNLGMDCNLDVDSMPDDNFWFVCMICRGLIKIGIEDPGVKARLIMHEHFNVSGLPFLIDGMFISQKIGIESVNYRCGDFVCMVNRVEFDEAKDIDMLPGLLMPMVNRLRTDYWAEKLRSLTERK